MLDGVIWGSYIFIHNTQTLSSFRSYLDYSWHMANDLGTKLRGLHGMGFLCSFPSQSRSNKTTDLHYSNIISLIRCPTQSACRRKDWVSFIKPEGAGLFQEWIAKKQWLGLSYFNHRMYRYYMYEIWYINKHRISKSAQMTLFNCNLPKRLHIKQTHKIHHDQAWYHYNPRFHTHRIFHIPDIYLTRCGRSSIYSIFISWSH